MTRQPLTSHQVVATRVPSGDQVAFQAGPTSWASEPSGRTTVVWIIPSSVDISATVSHSPVGDHSGPPPGSWVVAPLLRSRTHASPRSMTERLKAMVTPTGAQRGLQARLRMARLPPASTSATQIDPGKPASLRGRQS